MSANEHRWLHRSVSTVPSALFRQHRSVRVTGDWQVQRVLELVWMILGWQSSAQGRDQCPGSRSASAVGQRARSNTLHPMLSASRSRCFATSVASGHRVTATRHDCLCDPSVLRRWRWWQSTVNGEFQINGLLTILRCRSSRSLVGSYRSSFDHRKCCRYAQQMARILCPATN